MSANNEMTGGEALARMLQAHAVGPMFGMGGFQLLPFYDATRRLGLDHNLIRLKEFYDVISYFPVNQIPINGVIFCYRNKVSCDEDRFDKRKLEKSLSQCGRTNGVI